MKKTLSLIALIVFGMSISAQVTSTFPAIEDFEAGNLDNSNVILHYSSEWSIQDYAVTNGAPIYQGYNDNNFICVFNSETILCDSLETYAFDLTDKDNAKLSFYYANPDWQGDIDILEIGYRYGASDPYTYAITITEAHDDWTYYEIDLPVGDLIQLCFRATTTRGYGVYLDHIRIEIPDFPVVSEFPWTDDFDDQNLDGWTQSAPEWGNYLWTTYQGNYNDESPVTSTQLNSASYNALYFAKYEESAAIISPIFELGDADSASLEFNYSMEECIEDIDKVWISYRTSPTGAWEMLWHETNAQNDWKYVRLTLPELTDTYQFGFGAQGNWGYGVTIDDVVVTAYSSTGISENATANNTLSVYPNPASDYITVDREGNDEIFIYNTFGSLVKRTFENRIAVGEFAPGLYTIKTNEGTAKFIR